MMLIREAYLSKIRPFIGKEEMKIIVGLRRAGKSVLLQQIRDEINSPHTISIDFEDYENKPLHKADALYDFVQKKISYSKAKFYLFLDEVLEVEDWEKAINKICKKFNVDIYMTSSNSKILSGNFEREYVPFTIYPFSFSELKELNSDYTFNDYLKYGGMPFLSHINFKPEISKNYLKDLYNSILLKDIIKRHNIRDVVLLESIITHVFTNIGEPLSATDISKAFREQKRIVAPETIINYLKACEDAFLIYRLKTQDIYRKKIIQTNEEYFVVDNGLREAIVSINLDDDDDDEQAEKVLKNVVSLELLRRGHKVFTGRTKDENISLIGEKNGEKIYIQLYYWLDSERVAKYEANRLLQIKDNYPKFILFKASVFHGNHDGVRIMKAENWLLKEKNKNTT